MKAVIALDSFKESMKASLACQSVQNGLLSQDENIETLLCPLSDGGEGTLETLVEAMNGTIQYYEVCGPLFNLIQAPVGYVGNLAIIECAQVCGLELLDESQKNPYHTTTYGLGELINHAMSQGAKTIMICLGGSATNDGGIGMLQALGVSILDKNHQDVKSTMQGLFDISSINHFKEFKDVHFIGVCDVMNSLCGKNGATYTYGIQKGVLIDECEKIDQAMHKYALKVDGYLKHDYRHMPRTGAAGGLGYALLAFLHAELRNGFDVVSETVGLRQKIQESDIVIVGEGKMDRQTQYGKTPYGVLKIAQIYHKPVYAFAGLVEDIDLLKELGFQNIYQITPLGMELSQALKLGEDNLKQCVINHFKELL